MKEEVIGKRYAKALIQLGQEQDQLEQVSKEIAIFSALFDESEVLKRVLCNPIHDRNKRKAILGDVLKKLEFGTLCCNFLQLLLDKERMKYLPAIYSAYRRLEDSIAGRLRANLVVAQELQEGEKAAVKKALEEKFNKDIILEWLEDPDILGGIICNVDGMVFDGCVRTQLEILKETMKGE